MLVMPLPSIIPRAVGKKFPIANTKRSKIIFHNEIIYCNAKADRSFSIKKILFSIVTSNDWKHAERPSMIRPLKLDLLK